MSSARFPSQRIARINDACPRLLSIKPERSVKKVYTQAILPADPTCWGPEMGQMGSGRPSETHLSMTSGRSPLRPRRRDAGRRRPARRTLQIAEDLEGRRGPNQRHPQGHRLGAVGTEPAIHTEHPRLQVSRSPTDLSQSTTSLFLLFRSFGGFLAGFRVGFTSIGFGSICLICQSRTESAHSSKLEARHRRR